MEVILLSNADEIEDLCGGGRLPHSSAADFVKDHADAHLCAIGNSGEVEARCSLWWQRVPNHQQHRVGAIGHYAATTDPAADTLLASAQERLRTFGCTLSIGPLNGNTWHDYRFVIERSDQPAFFLESRNPPEWPRQFESSGFSSLASYFSSVNCDLSRPDQGAEAVASRLTNAGVTIRPAAADVQRELEGIYAVSRVAFRRNLLYMEIPFAEFAAIYEQMLPAIRPELVLLAERGGECVGYLFAVPDLTQAARGVAVDTFIVKTVAILPQRELRGLGTLLAMQAHQRGYEMGFRRCIHALMCANNASLNISRRYAKTIRKYTLYSKELTR
jgi:GNAT superfamily N-acetyltransferase